MVDHLLIFLLTKNVNHFSPNTNEIYTRLIYSPAALHQNTNNKRFPLIYLDGSYWKTTCQKWRPVIQHAVPCIVQVTVCFNKTAMGMQHTALEGEEGFEKGTLLEELILLQTKRL